MAVLKNKYEISLWEDLVSDYKSYILLTAEPLDWNSNITDYYQKSGDEYVVVTINPSTGKRPIWAENTYYDCAPRFIEKKIGVIGSDNMSSQGRAVEPCLTSNINGTNTLTFKMFYTYVDTQTGETVDNSWIPLLVNEARLKVNWKNKWYDFVIKNRVEDSTGKSVTFTCEDLFVNELSKTGFGLIYDTEKSNNRGTVFQLADRCLADTDWTLVKPGDTPPIVDGKYFSPEIIKQYKEEPVYYVSGAEIVRESFNGTDVETGNTITWTGLPGNQSFLLFYSQVENQESTLQVIHSNTKTFPTDTNSLLVTRNKVKRYDLFNITWEEETIDNISYWIIKKSTHPIFKIVKTKIVSGDYRAERLVDSQLSIYDPAAGQYVQQYYDTENPTQEWPNGKLTYGFQKTDYDTALMVTNLATWDVEGPSGWKASDNNVRWTIYPPFEKDTDVSNYRSEGYIKAKGGIMLTNNGLYEHRSSLPNGMQAGSQYMVRFRAAIGNDDGPQRVVGNELLKTQTVAINPYGSDKNFVLTTNAYQRVKHDNLWWHEYTFNCIKSITQDNLKNTSITIKYGTGNGNVLWITDVECFQIIRDEDDNIIYPGDFAAQMRAQVYYYYYDPSLPINKKATDKDDLEMIIVSHSPKSRFEPKLDPDNSKIRAISIKQSNRFNILQTLSETFQCWVKFGIVHNQDTGEIEIDPLNGMPKKYVTFVNSIGEDKGYGFVYGIDLKTIQRTVQSNQLVTKTFVQNNSNEFAIDKYCSIQRSLENVPRSNFILNLDYYVANGMLDGNILAKDLYSKIGDDLGYYIRLQDLNTKYLDLVPRRLKVLSELTSQQGLLSLYSNLTTSTQNDLNTVENHLISMSGKNNIEDALTYYKTNSNDQSKAWINDRSILINKLNNYNSLVEKLTTSTENLEAEASQLLTDQEKYTKQIKDLDKAFNTKYARYLQEGSWISEDYVDDDLYYLDGLNVAYTASRPQVQYNISVLRLTALDEFKYKIFNVGDLGFIEDKEFFGYEPDKITPIKEQIIVSQMASYFDSPERDTITIQNYKTQFEDLFQRITSTTQSLQLSQGTYNKTSSIFNTDMTIKADLLQSSLSQNLAIITSATHDTVVQDQTGITVVDETDRNKIAKLTSAGLAFSNDGGLTWTTGADADGIRPIYLKTGTINTNDILIGSADKPTFRWDNEGITAYKWEDNSGNTNVISSQFIRYDQYGIYGIQGYENFSSDGYFKPIDSTTTPWDSEKDYYELVNGEYHKLSNEHEPTDWGRTTIKYTIWPYNEDEWDSIKDSLYKENTTYSYEEWEPDEDEWKYLWNGLYVKVNEQYIANESMVYDSGTTYYIRNIIPADPPYIQNHDIVYDETQTYYVQSTSNITTYYEKVGDGLQSIEDYAYFGFTWNGFFLKGDGDSISITSKGGIEVFNPKWKFTSEATTAGGYYRSYDNDGNAYVANVDYIPVITIGRFYDNITDRNNQQFSYGMRLRDKNGFVTLSTDNKGDIWSLRQLRAGNTMYNNYEKIMSEPEDWITNYTDYYTYNNINETYTSVTGIIPAWTPNTYYQVSYSYDTWVFSEEEWEEKWMTLYYINAANQYVLNNDPEHHNITYYELVGEEYNLVASLPQGVTWENVYYNYYTKDIIHDTYEPVTTTYPTWEPGIYYSFNDEGSIAGLNGTILTVSDVQHLAPILTKLGVVNAYEVEVENTVTVGEVRQSTITQWKYNGTPASQIEENTDWKEHHEILYYRSNDDFILNENTAYVEDRIYYTYIDMNLDKFNIVNDTNMTQDTDKLSIGTYYVYADNVDLSEFAVRMWSGADETYSNSRFVVFKNGYVYAQQGYFEGSIYATNGNFSGKLTIGTGEAHGIDGSEDAHYVIWSGKEEDNYQFGVTNTGELHAKNAIIEGVINVDSGILRQIFLKDNGESGLSREEISMWINAENPMDRTTSAYYLTDSGQLYTSDVFLRGMIGIEPLPIPIYEDGTTYYVLGYESVGTSEYVSGTTYYKGQYGGEAPFTDFGQVDITEVYDNTKTYEPYGYEEYKGTTRPVDWGPTYFIQTGYDELDIITYELLTSDPGDLDTNYSKYYIKDPSNNQYIQLTEPAIWAEDTYYIAVGDYQVGDKIVDTVWIKKGNDYYQILIDQYYKQGINNKPKKLVFWEGNFDNVKFPTEMIYNFTVNDDGDVYARNLTLGNKLSAESVELDAELNVGNITISSAEKGIITNGDTWWIDGDGFALFRNAKVTGTLSTVSFEKESVSSVGGTLFISPSQVLESELINEVTYVSVPAAAPGENPPPWDNNMYYEYNSGTNTYILVTEKPNDWATSYTNYYTRDDTNKFILNRDVAQNDYFGIEWDTVDRISITYLGESDTGATEEKTEEVVLNHYDLLLSEPSDFETYYNKYYTYNAITREYIQLTAPATWMENTYYEEKMWFYFPSVGSFAAGTIFISTDINTSCISLAATDIEGDHNYGPHIIMRSPDYEKVVVGNLENQLRQSNAFKSIEHPGAGLYANNVYLEGRFYLPYVGLTNETTEYIGFDEELVPENKQIRIWAGALPEDKDKAPFAVTQDGTLYASKGIFKGTIEATDSTFSGWIKTAGILIDPEDDPHTEREDDKFYVAYSTYRSISGFPTNEDKILQIDKNGISIWEGGFNVYTDSKDSNMLPYIYTEEHIHPIPYIRAVDDLPSDQNPSGGSNFRLLTTKLQVAAAIDQNGRNQYFQGMNFVDNTISFQNIDNSTTELQTADDLWNKTSSFIMQYIPEESSLKFLQGEGNFIVFEDILDEEFVWSKNSGRLDVGITGSLDVKGVLEAKDGIKTGTGLEVPNEGAQPFGSYIWMKEYNQVGVYTKITSITVPTFTTNTYYKYANLKYSLLNSEPDDWATNYNDYYQLTNSYNSEYSGFDFFIE